MTANYTTPREATASNTEVARWMWEEGHRICPVCERTIGAEITAKRDPGRIELDHIGQRAWGGAHTWGNVRPMHRACNQFRGGGDGTALDYSPQQYRRAFGHSMDYDNAPYKARAKVRRIWVRWIERHLRAIDWWGIDLAEAETDEGRTKAPEAIAWNRAEAERRRGELEQLDQDFATWDERWREAAEAEADRAGSSHD